MHIRKARSADLEACQSLDHAVFTEYAWRMEEQEREGAITTTFQSIRLPRQVRVSYARSEEALTAGWEKSDLFLVAGNGRQVYGYTTASLLPGHGLVWVQDLVVDAAWRRQGIGGQLLQEVITWASGKRSQRLVVEVQTQNHPGVCFCRSLGLSFCGYNDAHWRTHDIALLFGMNLR